MRINKLKKLISYYKTYDEKEWGVVLDVRLPLVLNRDEKISKLLYQKIIDLYNRNLNENLSFDMSIRTLIKEEYDGRTLNENTISKYLNNMIAGMKTLLAQDELNNSPNLIRFLYAERLKRKEEFLTYFSELSIIGKAEDNGNCLSDTGKYLLLKDLYFHPSFDSHTEAGRKLFGNITDAIKMLSYPEYLKLYIQKVQLKQVTGNDLDSFPVVEFILEDILRNKFGGNKALRHYARITIFIQKEEKQASEIIDISNSFKKDIKMLSKNDGKYLYNLISNELIRLERMGFPNCFKEMITLDEACLNARIVHVNAKIPLGHFLNIVLKRCDYFVEESGNLDSMINFIDDLLKDVSETEKEYAGVITKKHTYLKFKQYKLADELHCGVFSEIHLELRYRCLELCCQFYLNKLFNEHARSFDRFLRKKNLELGLHQLEGNRAFLKCMKELAKLKTKKIKADEDIKKLNGISREVSLKKESIKSTNEIVVYKKLLLDVCTYLMPVIDA